MLDFLAMISDRMRAGFPGLVDASHWDVVEPCMGTYVVLTNSHRPRLLPAQEASA